MSRYRDITTSHAQTTSTDLQSFREALQVLQRQVDDLDELKAAHYQDIMEHEEEVWDFVQGKVCFSRKLKHRGGYINIP